MEKYVFVGISICVGKAMAIASYTWGNTYHVLAIDTRPTTSYIAVYVGIRPLTIFWNHVFN